MKIGVLAVPGVPNGLVKPTEKYGAVQRGYSAVRGDALKAQAAGYECERQNFTRYDDIDGYSLTVCSEYDRFSAGVELFTDGEQ